jgi:hypothetical protein
MFTFKLLMNAKYTKIFKGSGSTCSGISTTMSSPSQYFPQILILIFSMVFLTACPIDDGRQPGLETCTSNESCGGEQYCINGKCEECINDVHCDFGQKCSHSLYDCVNLDCELIYQPVCGVDGKTYANSCVATAFHVEVA